MNLIKCLFVVEKILIFAIILAFIPIAIYVFEAEKIIVSSEFQNFYINGMDPACYQDANTCNSIKSYIGSSAAAKYLQNYVSFRDTATYLMYFGQIPLTAVTLVVMFLDLCTRHNYRLMNSVLTLHLTLIGIGVIIKGYFFNSSNDAITDHLAKIGSQCLSVSSNCYQQFQNTFSTFSKSDNISSSFDVFMIIILIFMISCVVVMIIINVLMIIYYKFKDSEPTSTEYELQSL